MIGPDGLLYEDCSVSSGRDGQPTDDTGEPSRSPARRASTSGSVASLSLDRTEVKNFAADPLETENGFFYFFPAAATWRPEVVTVRDLRRAPVVSGAARTHFALWRIWLCALTTSPPFGVRPLVLTVFSTLLKLAQRASEDNYPPYNIERLGDDRYQISLALAGFAPDEISVTAEQNVVTIEGQKGGQGRARIYLSGHFRPARSSGNSTLPTTSRLRVPRSRTAC